MTQYSINIKYRLNFQEKMCEDCNDMNSYTLQGQKRLKLTLYCDEIIFCAKIGGI